MAFSVDKENCECYNYGISKLEALKYILRKEAKRMNKRITMRFFAVICLLLVLIYAVCLLLPHSHDGGAESCAVCTFIEVGGPAAAVIGIFVLSFEGELCSRIFDVFRNALILHDGAPVWLKVKLSD